jgi:hypothetical protein
MGLWLSKIDTSLQNRVFRVVVVAPDGQASPVAIGPVLAAASEAEASAARRRILEMDRLDPSSFKVLWSHEDRLYEMRHGAWTRTEWAPQKEQRGAWVP